MTFPHSPSSSGPRPGPPPSGFRPGPPPQHGFRPGPPPGTGRAEGNGRAEGAGDGSESLAPRDAGPQQEQDQPGRSQSSGGATGHPAVDAVLQALANATRLAPADQIAEYEAAHRVLQETLAGIDR